MQTAIIDEPMAPEVCPAPARRLATTFKSLLVHVEPTEASDDRLRFVVGLAAGLGAEVIGIGGCAPFIVDDVVALDLEMIREQESADLKDAEARFRRIASSLGDAADWRADAADPGEVMARSAAGADLIVASARRGPHASTVDAGLLALSAGGPVLVLPPRVRPPQRERIVVGWKNTREARRAVTDALPLLLDAEAVTVVAVSANGDQPVEGLDGVVDRLKRHGVNAGAHILRSRSDDYAGDLLTFAETNRADMIVSGAYGHPRLLEWCWGGVSAGLLERSTLPVLFSH